MVQYILNISQVKGVHFRRSRVANSVVDGPIRLSSLSTRMKKIQSKMKASLMFTTLCIDFSDAQGQLNSVVSGWISFKL